MAVIHSTRQFFDEIEIICTAFESMLPWVSNESDRVEYVQVPIIRRFRDLLDQADSIVGADDHLS